jgi:hypothetical protein
LHQPPGRNPVPRHKENDMGNDNIAIISFYEGWEEDGVGPDGLPLFKPVTRIRKAVPPYTQVDYVAVEDDYDEFPMQYQLFKKAQAARKPAVEGYPLALWPVISQADYQNCVARDIVTVEQLAKLAQRRSTNDIPAPIIELAKRAAKMIELQSSVGRFETVITDLTAQRDQMAAELKEANATISAQNSLIGQLRQSPAKVA